MKKIILVIIGSILVSTGILLPTVLAAFNEINEHNLIGILFTGILFIISGYLEIKTGAEL